jgi:hypothetical protein
MHMSCASPRTWIRVLTPIVGALGGLLQATHVFSRADYFHAAVYLASRPRWRSSARAPTQSTRCGLADGG